MKRKKADKVLASKRAKQEKPKLNAFEIRVNRKKYDIIGQKSKYDRGLPGISRSKAIKKRDQTLLKEYRHAHKTNRFVDMRIGEEDSDISPEDKMLQRFMRHKQRKAEKSSLFSLEEEEELTHFGKSLAEIDDFNEIDLSSDSEIEEDVGETHFGGFLTKKQKHDQGEDPTIKATKKSHKEIMEEVVAKSKAAKYERQETRRTVEDLLDQVNSEWKEISSLLVKDKNRDRKKMTADEYDKFVRELAFEEKGKPTSRMKSEEELALEEKEKLEKLEAQRLQRMRGEQGSSTTSGTQHKSVDELTSSTSGIKEARPVLAYQDGQATVKVVYEKIKFKKDNQEASDSGGVASDLDRVGSETGGEDMESDDNSEAGGEGMESDGNSEAGGEDTESDGNSEAGGEGMESDGSSEAGGKDMESDGSDVSLESGARGDCSNPNEAGRLDGEDENRGDDIDPADEFGSDLETSSEEGEGEGVYREDIIKEDSKANREQDTVRKRDETVASDIPYVIQVPQSFRELRDLFHNRSPAECEVIIARVLKCNHPSLDPQNKKKLKKLLPILLKYIISISEQPSIEAITIINALTKHVYDLCHMSPNKTATLFQKYLQIIRKQVLQKRPQYPLFSKLVIFKLIGALFPTSDYNHPITTPSRMIMGLLLSKVPMETAVDCARGLFLCSLLLEYEMLSKRYVPEVINCITNVIGLFCSADKKDVVMLPPQQGKGKSLRTALSSLPDGPQQRTKSLLELVISQSEAEKADLEVLEPLSILESVLALVDTALRLWHTLPSASEIFSSVLANLQSFQGGLEEGHFLELRTAQVKERLLNVCSRNKMALRMLQQKPKSIVFYEPKFEENFIVGRKKGSSKSDGERKKLLYKIKKAKKGAVREIRKDNAYLAKVKLQDQLESDAKRKKKVQQILNDIADQRADQKKVKTISMKK